MLFNSKVFVTFIVVTLGIYYWLPDRWKVYFLLLMSYVFYGFWDPWLCSLIALSTVVDFWCGKNIAANRTILVYFKYAYFFAESFNSIIGSQWHPINHFALLTNQISGSSFRVDQILLPIGISFYTFQTMSYSIDIFRKKLKPVKNIFDFGFYVSFFPQLVAGPVERAPHLLPQFSQPFRLSVSMVKEGVFLILLGFIKKVVIADRLALVIEPYYDSLATNAVDAALCMLLFTCQIYVDFSSYSDIAIGLGLLLGYHIRPNFNLPFVVPSIPERWRRWHLSMSHWFRDYIFIPLGGSRKGTVRTQVNIMILMFLSGLWHGASNNFVVWGLANGATMVSHRLLKRPLRAMSTLFSKNAVTKIGYYYLCCWNTFCTIATINIFFRCPTWESATSYVDMIFLSGLEDYLSVLKGVREIPIPIWDSFGWVLAVFTVHELQRYLNIKEEILNSWMAWSIVCVSMFWAVLSFGISGPQFIYYQF